MQRLKKGAFQMSTSAIGGGSISYDPEDITITMIRSRKPYKIFRWFEDHGCAIRKRYDGVYDIENAGFFETQIIVAGELDERNHIWLKSLIDRMDKNRQQKK